MGAFNACQFSNDFMRLQYFQTFYFKGVYNEGAGSYVDEDADKDINVLISIMEESMLNTLVVYALSFLDWNKDSNSLINLYRNYPCLVDESLTPLLLSKQHGERNEFFEGLMGDEIFSFYKKIKSHRNQNVAHFAHARQKLNTHKEELNTLIEFVKQKVFDASMHLKNDTFVAIKPDSTLKGKAKAFWSIIRNMKDLKYGKKEDFVRVFGPDEGEKIFNDWVMR